MPWTIDNHRTSGHGAGDRVACTRFRVLVLCLALTQASPLAEAVAAQGRAMVWTNSASGEIRRSDLNGLNGELLVSLPNQDLMAIAIESEPAVSVPARSGYGLSVLVCALIAGGRTIRRK